MDYAKICTIARQAFKSLTPETVDILKLDGSILVLQVVANRFKNQPLPDRFSQLFDLLSAAPSRLTSDYNVVFEAWTPQELTEKENPVNVDEDDEDELFTTDNAPSQDKKVAKPV